MRTVDPRSAAGAVSTGSRACVNPPRRMTTLPNRRFEEGGVGGLLDPLPAS
jgi:hypothetical protein